MNSTEQNHYDNRLNNSARQAVSVVAHDHGLTTSNASELAVHMGAGTQVADLILAVAETAARIAMEKVGVTRPEDIRTEASPEEHEAGKDCLVTFERSMYVRQVQRIQAALPRTNVDKILGREPLLTDADHRETSMSDIDEMITQHGNYIDETVYGLCDEDELTLEIISVDGEPTFHTV